MLLSKVNIKVHPLVDFKGEHLINRSDFIQSFLEKKLDFARDIQLADASLTDEAIEFTAPNNSHYKSLDDFTVHEKEEIVLAYNRIRYAIKDYFDEHKESDSRLIEWKEILDEVFTRSGRQWRGPMLRERAVQTSLWARRPQHRHLSSSLPLLWPK